MPRDEAPLQPSQTAVILVNYRTPSLTLGCLEALATLDSPPGRIIVVDNGSPDGSARDLAGAVAGRLWPVKPEIAALESNFGFAAGNNTALRLLAQDPSIRAYWLLNTDTIPAPDSLERLCGRLNLPDSPGACGSVLLQPGDPSLIQCAGGGAFNRLTGTSHFILEGRRLDEGVSGQDAELKLDYLCAASMLVRRETVEAVGLLDEDYFLYGEDVAWCLRMRRAGFVLGVAADSLVVHLEGGTTGAKSRGKGGSPPRPEMVDYLSLRNRVRIAARFHPLLLPVVAASFMGVMLKRIQRRQADRFGLVLRALWDGLAGNMGPPPPGLGGGPARA